MSEKESYPRFSSSKILGFVEDIAIALFIFILFLMTDTENNEILGFVLGTISGIIIAKRWLR